MPTMSLANYENNINRSFLRESLIKLNRRKLFITVIMLATFVTLATSIQFLPLSYTGLASVEIESEAPKAVKLGEVISDVPFGEQTVGTEMAILRSREIMMVVLDDLHLLADPEFNPHLNGNIIRQLQVFVTTYFDRLIGNGMASTGDKVLDDTLATLQRHVKLTPVPRSRVIDIEARSENNTTAASIANTLAKAYIADHLDRKRKVSEEAHKFIDQKLEERKKLASDAARAVEDFRVTNGLSDGEHATLLQEQITQVSKMLAEAQARLDALTSQANIANNADPISLASTLSSQTITHLRELEADVAGKRATAVHRYGENSPFVQVIDAQLKDVRSGIAAEARRWVNSLPHEVASAKLSVASLSTQLKMLATQVANMEIARGRLATLVDQSEAARGLYREFLSRLQATDSAVLYPSTPVRIMSASAIPTRASFPNNMILLPIALFLSSAIAVFVALLAEARYQGVVSSAELDELGLATIGMIPVYRKRSIALYEDSLDKIWNQVMHSFSFSPPKSILITSALPDEGKTTVARSFADIGTRLGMKVILVQADLRGVRRREVPEKGLGEILDGKIKWQDVVRQPQGTLTIIPPGCSPTNPTRLIAMPRMEPTLRQLEAEYDLVVIDSPPVTVGDEARMLSRIVGRTIILARWRRTRADQIMLAVKQLSSDRLAGVALNFVYPKIIRSYKYGDATRFSSRLSRYYQA